MYKEEIDKAIEKYNTKYLSYGTGVALYNMMKNCDMSDDMRDFIYEYIDSTYSEVVAMLKAYGLSDGDMSVWSELMPLDTLDELARELSGKEE